MSSTKQDNYIAIIDCNNFYVSCERIFNPKIKEKPTVVLSNNDGCVIARSQEVKDLGVKMGTPIFLINHLVEIHNINVYSSNFALYGDISNRIMSIIKDDNPDAEHLRLSKNFQLIAESGTKAILSNHNNPRALSIFVENKKNIFVYEINLTKTIGRVKGSANTSSELLISTFEIETLEDSRIN